MIRHIDFRIAETNPQMARAWRLSYGAFLRTLPPSSNSTMVGG